MSVISWISKVLEPILGFMLFMVLVLALTQYFELKEKKEKRDIYDDSYYLLYERSNSSDNSHIIESRVYRHGQPDIFLIKNDAKGAKIETKLTSGSAIHFSPVVNNRGDYAYAVSDISNSESVVVYNGATVEATKNKSLYNYLAISDSFLVFGENRFYDGANFIHAIKLPSFETVKISVPFYVQKLSIIDKDRVLISAFDKKRLVNNLYSLDIVNKQIKPFILSDNDVFYTRNHTNGDVLIYHVSNSMSPNLKLLFNAMKNCAWYQKGEPFSIGNDFYGRISWNQTYRLEALTKLYRLTKDEGIKNEILDAIDNVLSVSNGEVNSSIADNFNHEHSYASRKYSIDKQTNLGFLVHDGRIYYAILFALNTIESIKSDKRLISALKKVNERLSSLYEYYEAFYNSKERQYLFPKGSPFALDGIDLPYNMQNQFGLALIEAIKSYQFIDSHNCKMRSVHIPVPEIPGSSTSSIIEELSCYKVNHERQTEKYKHRIFEIAKKFKDDFVYIDEKLIWHYFPSSYYKGWLKEQNKSINTPSRKEYNDTLYEDLSHAGINVKFILEFYSLFPEEVFTIDDIHRLRNTVDGFIIGGAFSRFMSGDTAYQKPEYRFIPSYGWPALNYSNLNRFYIRNNPMIHPDFDSQSWGKYLDAIDNERIGKENIVIKQEIYTADLVLKASDNVGYNFRTLKDCDCFKRND